VNVGVPSIIARRYRDIVAALVDDQGGADRLSQTRLQLVHRFAAAALLAEQMEAALARGEKINITAHALVCGTLVRVARIIGVDRTTQDATPTLADYLRPQQEWSESNDPRQQPRALARRSNRIYRAGSDRS
jgi:hypothetical protein